MKEGGGMLPDRQYVELSPRAWKRLKIIGSAIVIGASLLYIWWRFGGDPPPATSSVTVEHVQQHLVDQGGRA